MNLLKSRKKYSKNKKHLKSKSNTNAIKANADESFSSALEEIFATAINTEKVESTSVAVLKTSKFLKMSCIKYVVNLSHDLRN